MDIPPDSFFVAVLPDGHSFFDCSITVLHENLLILPSVHPFLTKDSFVYHFVQNGFIFYAFMI